MISWEQKNPVNCVLFKAPQMKCQSTPLHSTVAKFLQTITVWRAFFLVSDSRSQHELCQLCASDSAHCPPSPRVLAPIFAELELEVPNLKRSPEKKREGDSESEPNKTQRNDLHWVWIHTCKYIEMYMWVCVCKDTHVCTCMHMCVQYVHYYNILYVCNGIRVCMCVK